MRGFVEAYQATKEPAVAIPVPRVCDNCAALAHYWEKQKSQDIELGELRYELLAWRCVCTCRCPAVMTTTSANLSPDDSKDGGEAIESREPPLA